jgi:hypothetical protein
MANEQSTTPAEQGNESGEPSEAAKVLHGEQARAERYDQPEAVTLPGDTRVATGEGDEDGESKGSL